MNEDIKARASLNAIGNGALTGGMGNAGTKTGFLGSVGLDVGLDATNQFGAFTDEETGGTEMFELHEEVDDFTCQNTNQTAVNVISMGSFDGGSMSDNGMNTSELSGLSSINGNDFSY